MGNANQSGITSSSKEDSKLSNNNIENIKRSSIHSYNRFKQPSSRLDRVDDILNDNSCTNNETNQFSENDPDYLNIYSTSSGKQAGRYQTQTEDVVFVSHLTKTLHRSNSDLRPPTSPLLKNINNGTTVRTSITRYRSNSKHGQQEFSMKLAGSGAGSADSNLSTVFTADVTSFTERDPGSPCSSAGPSYSDKSTPGLDESVLLDEVNVSCSSIPNDTPIKTEDSVLSDHLRTRTRSIIHRHRASTISTEHRDSIVIEQSLSEKLALSSINAPYTISPVVSQDQIVVIDHGSSNMRVGFSNSEIPSSIFPSVVSSQMSASESSDQRSYFVGKPATQKPTRRMSYINGRISNWEDMEAIWEHSFSNCLKVDTRTAKVFLTEAANIEKSIRERMVETMFELFDVESTYLHLQPTLALFASGSTTGCVVDSGEYRTTICPIADGYLIPHACQRLPYGGAHITELLTRALTEKGYGPRFNEPTSLHHLPTEKKLSIMKHIKEECAYVQTSISRSSLHTKQLDTPQPYTSKSGITHILPDGTSVTLEEELHSCTEKMFQPYGFSQILSCETADITIHQTIIKSIMKCGVDSRRMLIGNIVPAGGNTSMPGFNSRLRNELKAHTSNKALSSAVAINPLTSPGNAVWLGGSIVCSMSTFEEQWISAEDYDEAGPSVVHTKCPAISLF